MYTPGLMVKNQAVKTNRKGNDMSTKQIRNALCKMFGARNFRITRDGEIHTKGVLPNTGCEGWYVFGSVHDSVTMYQLGLAD